MSREITAEPLTARAFAPFGDVIEKRARPDMLINAGKCARHHALASVDADADAPIDISIFHSQPCRLPLVLDMLERHPKGSQAFMPLSGDPFLVVVAPDAGGAPGKPQAFLTDGRQGVQYARNVWHGVLTPLRRASDFLVVDRIGHGDNLEIHRFDRPYSVHAEDT
ncbi:MAG: ureidoglycolate lyase [Paracoccaceae bacterium]